MPLAYLAALAGAVLLVAGWTGRSLQDTLLGNSDRLPDSSPGDYPLSGVAGSATGVDTSGVTGNPLDALAAAADHAGLITYDGLPIAHWIKHYLDYARAHGWTGRVTSGYRTYAQQAAIYNSGVRPAAAPGTSNHEGAFYPRGAVDVTEAPMLSSILSHYPGGSLLVWAGAADPVHFSHPHNGSY